MIVLPGTVNEDSDYQQDFTNQDQKQLLSFHDHGGVSLNICGGANFVSRLINYNSNTTHPRRVLSLNPLFKGHAEGPIHPFAQKMDGTFGVLKLSMAKILIKDLLQQEWIKTSVTYANGPAFYPDKKDDPSIEILMKYDIPDTPAAGIRVSIGKGAAYLLGPHIENGVMHTTPNILERNPALAAYNNMVAPFEFIRQEFMQELAAKMVNDIIATNAFRFKRFLRIREHVR